MAIRWPPSVGRGEPVELFVSTDAPTFDVAVVREGAGSANPSGAPKASPDDRTTRPRTPPRTAAAGPPRDSIGALTFDAGHHTVYQHANFEFGLENISRQFVWTSLHSYPFYNSEQSSQRYVKLKEPRAFVPPITGEALDVYERAIVRGVGQLRRALGASQGRCVRDPEASCATSRHARARSG